MFAIFSTATLALKKAEPNKSLDPFSVLNFIFNDWSNSLLTSLIDSSLFKSSKEIGLEKSEVVKLLVSLTTGVPSSEKFFCVKSLPSVF